MHHKLLTTITALAFLSGTSAFAEDHEHMDHQKHMASMNGDQRQLVDYPPDVKVHFLSNMREHLQALSDIMVAMAEGQYDKAASIANTKLGMDSPSASGCKMGSSIEIKDSKTDSKEHQMMQYMPPLMRQAGVEMHQAASDFAIEVSKVTSSGDSKPALSALARVTQRCISCHASFRAQ